MPVYLYICNLIIKKESIIQKYKGGLAQFRVDFEIDNSEINQEDDKLISLGQIDFDSFDVEKNISGGLHFDKEKQYSEDFAFVYRYGNEFWNVNWLEENSVFAWHINSDPKLIERAKEISAISMDQIIERYNLGENLLSTVK